MGFPIIFLQQLGLATLNLARSLGLPRPIIKSHAEERMGVALGKESSQKYGGFPSIFTQWLKLATSNLVHSLGLTCKAHDKITPIGKSGCGLGLGELPKILWFHFNIYTMAEARDF